MFVYGVRGKGDVLIPMTNLEAGDRPRNYENLNIKIADEVHLRGHLKSINIKETAPASVWNEYFKFYVKINPWGKMISFYYFHTRIASDNTESQWQGLTLDRFLVECAGRSYYPSDFDSCTDVDGRLRVDRMLRYESLDQELTQMFGQLGIPFADKLGIRARAIIAGIADITASCCPPIRRSGSAGHFGERSTRSSMAIERAGAIRLIRPISPISPIRPIQL